MAAPSPEELKRWRTEFEKASTRLLDFSLEEEESAAAADADFDVIVKAGLQSRRYYHDIFHFLDDIANAGKETDKNGFNILQIELRNHGLGEHLHHVMAVLTRAGGHHDVVYVQIDKGLLPEIEAVILPFIEQRTDGIYPKEPPAGASDAERRVYQMALVLFGAHPGEKLKPFAGQNEFLSALYAGLAGLRSGIAEKYILAEIATIEATVPFGQVERMEKLRERVAKANALLHPGERLSDDEIEAFLCGAVQMANKDVASFHKSSPGFIKIGHQLLRENATTLETPLGMYQACTGVDEFFNTTLSAEKNLPVFHSYRGFPPLQQVEEWDAVARQNIAMQRERMHSYAVAAALVAAIAMAEEQDAEAPNRPFTALFRNPDVDPETRFPAALKAVHKAYDALSNGEKTAICQAMLHPEDGKEIMPQTIGQAQALLNIVPEPLYRVLVEQMSDADTRPAPIESQSAYGS